MTSTSTFVGSSEESATRSGETRRKDTRQRIIDAVVESVTQVGIHRTTGKEIARRSGLTWGAVQHHFGDKDGIFDAVLDSSLETFTGYLEGLPPPEAPLEERIDAFVDATWHHFRSALAAASIEIRLATMRPEDSPYQRGQSNDRLANRYASTASGSSRCRMAARRTSPSGSDSASPRRVASSSPARAWRRTVGSECSCFLRNQSFQPIRPSRATISRVAASV